MPPQRDNVENTRVYTLYRGKNELDLFVQIKTRQCYAQVHLPISTDTSQLTGSGKLSTS